MQITFDTDNSADVARVLAIINQTTSDTRRLLLSLRADKVKVLQTIAMMCKGNRTPTVDEVAEKLCIPPKTLVSHKMNIGRTVARLEAANPVRTFYVNGKATYSMSKEIRREVLQFRK